MAKYVWQCASCGDRPSWLTVCNSRSIGAFIFDELAPSGWDQKLLRRRCKCGRQSLYIGYKAPRGDADRISIRHISGLVLENDYMPMLWETFRHASPKVKWIDFKYQRGRSPWGLTKHLVLKQMHLAKLLAMYESARKPAMRRANV